jgi:hypothetical protein
MKKHTKEELERMTREELFEALESEMRELGLPTIFDHEEDDLIAPDLLVPNPIPAEKIPALIASIRRKHARPRSSCLRGR